MFGDPELSALVERIPDANQNLRIAEARLREARAKVKFNRAALFPTISAGVGASSIRASSNRPCVERRPDIAAAERRVAEANEAIGIAKAAFYPTVMLNASVGFESASPASWFNWPSLLWAVGTSITQTLLDAGRRRATSDATLAQYDATVASYRQVTLSACQQVEDNLSGLRVLEFEADDQRRAVLSADESLRLATNRYRGGADAYLPVITAQTFALANRRNEIDILRRRLAASVVLIKALGGGWTVSDLPTP